MRVCLGLCEGLVWFVVVVVVVVAGLGVVVPFVKGKSERV